MITEREGRDGYQRHNGECQRLNDCVLAYACVVCVCPPYLLSVQLALRRKPLSMHLKLRLVRLTRERVGERTMRAERGMLAKLRTHRSLSMLRDGVRLLASLLHGLPRVELRLLGPLAGCQDDGCKITEVDRRITITMNVGTGICPQRQMMILMN